MISITIADIDDWRAGMKGGPATEHVKLKILRIFFEDARRDRIVDRNVVKDARPAKTTPTERRAFTTDELERVLAISPQPWVGMILFGAFTGQRLGDLHRLRREDIADGVLRIRQRKTTAKVAVPLAPQVLEWVQKHAGETFLFDPLDKFAGGTLSNQFTRLLSKAGLREHVSHKTDLGKGRDGKRDKGQLCFHCLRHTAISMLRIAGAPLAISQGIAGHRSTAIHDLYTHTTVDDSRRYIDALPALNLDASSAGTHSTAPKKRPMQRKPRARSRTQDSTIGTADK
jgi:integrase